jgi:hypothetical protein
MNRSASRGLLAVVFVSLAGFAPSAFAYLDPSTGSMILSAILGIFATVGLALKTYWYKLKSFFRKSDGQSANPATTPDSDTAE